MRINTCLATFAAVFALCCAACSNRAVEPPATPLASQDAARPSIHLHWKATSIGQFGDPYGVAVAPNCAGSSCTVVVADPGNKKIFAVKPDGSRDVLLDAARMGGVFDPQGVSVDSDGDVFIADKEHTHNAAVESYIEELRPSGRLIVHLGSGVTFPLYYRDVSAFLFSPLHGAIYGAVASRLPLSAKGRLHCQPYLGAYNPCLFSSTVFNDPYGVAVDEHKQIYVVDPSAKKAYRIGPNGVHDLGMNFVDPYGIAVTPDGGYVYVADAGAKRVYERAPDGTWTTIGSFTDPYTVAVSNDRTVWVADPGSKHVWKLSP